jgi:hypothetical protein
MFLGYSGTISLGKVPEDLRVMRGLYLRDGLGGHGARDTVVARNP